MKSRVLHEGEWSALSEAVFEVPVTGIQISEIMYHPSEPAQPSEWTDNDFEFIELRNRSEDTIFLSSLEFSDGISFDFANSSTKSLDPDEFTLVVADKEAFT